MARRLSRLGRLESRSRYRVKVGGVVRVPDAVGFPPPPGWEPEGGWPEGGILLVPEILPLDVWSQRAEEYLRRRVTDETAQFAPPRPSR